MSQCTFPWPFEAEFNAVRKRDYQCLVDKRGMTLEWEDATITEESVRSLIARWVNEDKIAPRGRLRRKQVSDLPGSPRHIACQK